MRERVMREREEGDGGRETKKVEVDGEGKVGI